MSNRGEGELGCLLVFVIIIFLFNIGWIKEVIEHAVGMR